MKRSKIGLFTVALLLLMILVFVFAGGSKETKKEAEKTVPVTKEKKVEPVKVEKLKKEIRTRGSSGSDSCVVYRDSTNRRG